MIKFVEEPEKFRRWIKSFGVFSSIVYMLIVLLQVVIAIIPIFLSSYLDNKIAKEFKNVFCEKLKQIIKNLI